MSEKCYYLDAVVDVEFDTPCGENNGYGAGEPDYCDDCDEYFCSKHLRQHKRDGTCRAIQEEMGEEEWQDIKEDLKEIPTRLLEEELARRKKIDGRR